MSGALWPRALIFDFDGTLADSFAAIAEALGDALREAGYRRRGLAWVRAHVGRGAAALVRDAAPGVDVAELAAVRRAFDRHYRAIFLERTPPRAGAAQVLADVAARTGGRIGVVSNKAAGLCRDWLEHWGLAAHVGTVSGPDTSGAHKPDRAALAPVLARLEVEPAEALLVGDMEIDVATGRHAGVPVVAVCGGAAAAGALRRSGALAVLGELLELPAWLAANGSGWGQ